MEYLDPKTNTEIEKKTSTIFQYLYDRFPRLRGTGVLPPGGTILVLVLVGPSAATKTQVLLAVNELQTKHKNIKKTKQKTRTKNKDKHTAATKTQVLLLCCLQSMNSRQNIKKILIKKKITKDKD